MSEVTERHDPTKQASGTGEKVHVLGVRGTSTLFGINFINWNTIDQE